MSVHVYKVNVYVAGFDNPGYESKKHNYSYYIWHFLRIFFESTSNLAFILSCVFQFAYLQ